MQHILSCIICPFVFFFFFFRVNIDNAITWETVTSLKWFVSWFWYMNRKTKQDYIQFGKKLFCEYISNVINCNYIILWHYFIWSHASWNNEHTEYFILTVTLTHTLHIEVTKIFVSVCSTILIRFWKHYDANTQTVLELHFNCIFSHHIIQFSFSLIFVHKWV